MVPNNPTLAMAKEHLPQGDFDRKSRPVNSIPTGHEGNRNTRQKIDRTRLRQTRSLDRTHNASSTHATSNQRLRAMMEAKCNSPSAPPNTSTRPWNPHQSLSKLNGALYARINSSFSNLATALEHQEEGPLFEKEKAALSYTDRDIQSIIMEDEAFRNLKASLRQRGCITNNYLKENVHFYVRHVKQVRQRRALAAANGEGRKIRLRRQTRSLTPPRSKSNAAA
ncbi:expressed unknown protein [Seminavis robusta]|uniref:Uncharacterized protein n=1 Tax=Seminavis robusta TaxID=568900 RepID=A0A9N8HV99_9STRA|nr:expressed unknown protein [Seminavis robusta]|eukprot:Sro1766_g296250.1 n/a (224) ;mRNA; f:15278-15949